jgi:hypothetical protein
LSSAARAAGAAQAETNAANAHTSNILFSITLLPLFATFAHRSHQLEASVTLNPVERNHCAEVMAE